ncbi:hypothetical protein RLPCCGM1_c3966 [Rhizobium leguminosarum bv. phaseoli CCGM1]|nr:hypothetical protein RHECNPAF_1760051 [Rhizobium etli CNPAF512]KEC72587.1 hypothetical protein RLPCCGM1_c3966 [Rhizobium leguminosarum bv. phaseoli CCGM1]
MLIETIQHPGDTQHAAPVQNDLARDISFAANKGLTLRRHDFGRCLHAGN